MTAATLDLLSGGRFRLGLGVSGPQVSEGWHGVRFAEPLARTREYVDVVRSALARETVRLRRASTTRCRCPTGRARRCGWAPPAPRATPDLPGRGRPEEPRAGRRDRRRLAGGVLRPGRRGGAARARRAPAGRAPGRTWTASTWCRRVPLVVGDDPQACADPVRPYAALYVGGMGSREQNFYNALAVRMGYGEAAAADPGPVPGPAARATPRPRCPYEFIDRTSLLGDRARIADGWPGSPPRASRPAPSARTARRSRAAGRAHPRRRGAERSGSSALRDHPQRAPLPPPPGDRNPLRRFRGRMPSAGQRLDRRRRGAPGGLDGVVLPGRRRRARRGRRPGGRGQRPRRAAPRPRGGAGLVVNLLGWAHRQLAEAFAGQAPAPGGVFRLGEWTESAWGPVLVGHGRLARRPAPAGAARHAGWGLLVRATVEHVELAAARGRAAGPRPRPLPGGPGLRRPAASPWRLD